MASNQTPTSTIQTKFALPNTDLEHQHQHHPTRTQATQAKDVDVVQDLDYSKRAQWLRAAVLGANDGLVSTASLMMGVGAVRQDIKAMILSGFAGLVAGACSMAIGEFVSVYSQLDIELAQMKREKEKKSHRRKIDEEEEDDNDDKDDEEKESLPNPLQAGAASALAFSVGAMVPLLAASFIRDYKVRVGVVVGSVSVALVAFGWLGAVLGKAPTLRSSGRVLFGGWLAMAVTFGLTKLIGSSGL
ncbi:vacuolar iron transporter homolog 1-like [Prosopis cineraria]|uniref:vacuolar iron transporter homolog 1-like n=1 Tax=Prosopis cineraria TaxID=364024 RepID=UPI002410A67D|nr:vacuolar iron transporter homolog 1-like [Prosopis cineraria]